MECLHGCVGVWTYYEVLWDSIKAVYDSKLYKAFRGFGALEEALHGR